jgi:quercetin dioxygenase-like cupin family protein
MASESGRGYNHHAVAREAKLDEVVERMRLEVIRWNGAAIPDEEVLREQLQGDGYDVFRWRDEAGTDYQRHSHDADECLWVLAGEMLFEAEGSQFHVRAGDRLVLPRGTVHTARAGADGVTYLIGERR